MLKALIEKNLCYVNEKQTKSKCLNLLKMPSNVKYSATGTVGSPKEAGAQPQQHSEQ